MSKIHSQPFSKRVLLLITTFLVTLARAQDLVMDMEDIAFVASEV